MLKLQDDIKRTFFFSYIGSFILFLLVAYISIKELLISYIEDALLLTKVLKEYDFIWGMLILLFLLLALLSYFIVQRLSKKITSDIESKITYLEEINSKNYDAIIKIENYVEFLKMSLLLKNLVKRLKQKEKKASKK